MRKAFNLEQMLAGHPVITRSGRTPASLTYFADALQEEYPIYGVIDGELHSWTRVGTFFCDDSEDHQHDLFMAAVKKTVYINIYPGSNTKKQVHETLEAAATYLLPGGYTVEAHYED